MRVLQATRYIEKRLGSVALLAIALYLLGERISDYIRYSDRIIFNASSELRIHSVAMFYFCVALPGLLPKRWKPVRLGLWVGAALIALWWVVAMFVTVTQGTF